ncbi:MAG TPA: TIGR04222 domain-containing membrane protein [Geodermatophilus sp.]|nr:TIGR04222 domain-containing membrane protein [Geodermatophilus sp.]
MITSGDVTHLDVDVYEAAFLAGGPARVVDTAVVALVRAGRVRVHSPGQLATAEPTRRHPVEAAVLDGIGPVGHRSVDTIRWRLADDPRIDDVERRLRQEGLLRRSVTVVRHVAVLASVSRSGRRLLTRLRNERGATDDVWRVALGGRAAMQDERLRAAIFEPPRTEYDVSRRSIRAARRELAAQDPSLAARHTFGTAVGGATVIGLSHGGDGFSGLADGGGGDGGGG